MGCVTGVIDISDDLGEVSLVQAFSYWEILTTFFHWNLFKIINFVGFTYN